MSKRVTGRPFGAHNEAVRKQIIAPVWAWKKEMVTPQGVPPESTYKIAKWVKTQQRATFDTSISGGSIEVEADDPEENAMEVEEDEGDVEPEAAEEELEGEAEAEEGVGSAAKLENRGSETPLEAPVDQPTILKATVPDTSLTVSEDPAAARDTNPRDGLVEVSNEARLGVDGVSGHVFMTGSENPETQPVGSDQMEVEADREGDLQAAVLGETSTRHPDEEETSDPLHHPQPTVRPIPSNAIEATPTNTHSNQFGGQIDLAQPGDLTFSSATEAETATADERVEMEGVKEPGVPLGEGDTVGVNGVMDVGDEDIVRANQAEQGQ